MSSSGSVSGQLPALCSLADPTRATLYDYVAQRGEPTTRDDAAAAVGVDRAVAAYHLDKLVAEGLLTPSFARPEGRGGPGAGRPAKRYEPSDAELEVSVPPRGYRLAAQLLVRAVAAEPDPRVRRTLEAAARELGTELAEPSGRSTHLWDALERLGYRPYHDGEVARLRNCPFQQLAREHTEVICGMNLALVEGLADAAADRWTPVLDPAPGECCVVLHGEPGTTTAERS